MGVAGHDQATVLMRDFKDGADPRLVNGRDGIDYVRCRVCGDRRRVISGLHLKKHEITRDEYIEEFELGPDQLVASDFRTLRSGKPTFMPFNRRTWIAAIIESR